MKRKMFILFVLLLSSFVFSADYEVGGVRIKAVVPVQDNLFKIRIYNLNTSTCSSCNDYTWIHVRPENVGGFNNFERVYALCLAAAANTNNVWLSFNNNADNAIYELDVIVLDGK